MPHVRICAGGAQQWASLPRFPLHRGLKMILRDQKFALKTERVAGDTLVMELWLLGGSGRHTAHVDMGESKGLEFEELAEVAEENLEHLAESPDEDLRDLAVEASDPVLVTRLWFTWEIAQQVRRTLRCSLLV